MTWLFHLVMHLCSFNIHLQQKHVGAEWSQWQIKIEGHQFLINHADWSLSKSYGKRHQQHLNFSCTSLQVRTKAQQTWTMQLAYWWLLILILLSAAIQSKKEKNNLRILIIRKVKFNKSILLIQIIFATNTSICLDGDKHHSNSKKKISKE